MNPSPPEGSRLDAKDLQLFHAGRHRSLHEHLGAHVARLDGADGVWFSVWAPAARTVRVVGDFNRWHGRGSELIRRGDGGVWETFVPGAGAGHRYSFEITTPSGEVLIKSDPMAFQVELPPATASVVHQPVHEWSDERWLAERTDQHGARPMSVYEVHVGSWRHGRTGGAEMTYRELAVALADYVTDMGFTHVELMPVMAHPFGGSWGYQVTSYYAPSPRWGSPDDFAALVDHLHGHGVGVILDWVPAHFPRDAWSLGRFDGTALYEHNDPVRSAHPDWGTLVFDYGRNEVRSFLLSNAAFWVERYHVDGIRVDAVASMLYLDYSRAAGQWVPNRLGGREDLDAVDFVRELNAGLHDADPGVLSVAEESTAWPGVSRPVQEGGLGFALKWNLGWMHDTLAYFAEAPGNRRHHHERLTFPFVYAFSERFILPLSHDEVVHAKGSLLGKMPGRPGERLANLRALYGLMWAHPGKQLLFMGGELAQEREWSHERELDWHLLADRGHAGVQRLVRDLNHRAHRRPALWAADFDPDGFSWLVGDDAESGVIAFVRRDPVGGGLVVLAANLSAVPCPGYRIGLPVAGEWQLVIDTDARRYGGSGAFTDAQSVVLAQEIAWHEQAASVPLDLPALTVVWLEPRTAQAVPAR